jgi:hypothetical protein
MKKLQYMICALPLLATGAFAQNSGNYIPPNAVLTPPDAIATQPPLMPQIQKAKAPVDYVGFGVISGKTGEFGEFGAFARYGHRFENDFGLEIERGRTNTDSFNGKTGDSYYHGLYGVKHFINDTNDGGFTDKFIKLGLVRMTRHDVYESKIGNTNVAVGAGIMHSFGQYGGVRFEYTYQNDEYGESHLNASYQFSF